MNNSINSTVADQFNKENFADIFEESINDENSEGDVVTGKVVAIENGIVVVDVGLKTEGRVPLKEFTVGGGNDVNIGDQVEVYLERIEGVSGGGSLVSHEKALRKKSWKNLEENYKDGDVIEGHIFGRVKGGFTVDITGVIAFLPGSQVDIRPIRDITPLMNIKQPFQILKMDTDQGNVIVSRRAILEESRAEERTEMLSQIKEGVELDGVIKNITDYGAFVDLGSLDGLLHVTDISWTRISHPSEVLSLGQEVKVKVIKFNEETKRISLGMKQLEGNPWAGITDKFPIGSQFKGVVTNIADYGAFVQLDKGIEGLVHVSEISWTKGNAHPSKYLSVGKEVNVMVLEIDEDKNRISLGMKQCVDNPWEAFSEKNPVGSVVEGEVKNAVDFGLFVGLEGDVDGLIHMSDVSWDENPEREVKKLKAGEKIQVKILAIEPEKERVSLGIKQLIDDPRAAAIEGITRGSRVTCVVSGVKNEGIDVTINEKVKTFIKRNELSKDRVEQRTDRFAVGDKIDAKVIGVDKNNSSINVSIKALEADEQKDAIEAYGSADSGASLGDILGVVLDEKK